MAVDAISVSFVILPVAIVDISVSVDQSALSIRFIVDPVALIHGAVGPYLGSATLSDLYVLRVG